MSARSASREPLGTNVASCPGIQARLLRLRRLIVHSGELRNVRYGMKYGSRFHANTMDGCQAPKAFEAPVHSFVTP